MDIRKLESALQIQLPGWYVEIVERASAEGGFQEIMTNENDIIDWNKKYRSGFSGCPPWTSNLYLIGDDGAASCYAIDLKNPNKRIVLFDHGNPGKILEEIADVDSWVNQTSADYKALKSSAGKKPGFGMSLLIGTAVVFLLAGALATVVSIYRWIVGG